MLRRLSVTNLAVVEKAEAEFSNALNVLTGETGAGKSVLMGALALVAGDRADSSIVRDGAHEAVVEAEFYLDKIDIREYVDGVLEEAGLPLTEEGVLVVRRSVSAASGGKIRVNDASATLNTLRRLAARLVDIHGARSNQRIYEEKFQRETLDSFASVEKQLNEYRLVYDAMGEVMRRLAELKAVGEGGVGEEIETLKYQIAEIEAAGLGEDDETLKERHAAAAHAGDFIESANFITESLGGDDGALGRLASTISHFKQISRFVPAAEEWEREVESFISGIEDLSRNIAGEAMKFDCANEDLEELDKRLTLVNKLKRKYGSSVSEILAKLEQKKSRLEELENIDVRINELEKELKTVRKSAVEAASRITAKRLKAARALAQTVTRELRDLSFREAEFSVVLEPQELTASGGDKVVYHFMPNPGEKARPLADIASSGETARVMLALKNVIAVHDNTDLLVFDEIDANVGGETGKAVGEKMKSVADYRQVIAITHLPQSAVYGRRHLVVEKTVDGGRTKTKIYPVEGDERVREIARMLGGEKLTSVVKKHAEELLSLSR
jgi:DNA repair protein RecN (Recombination protein N)